MAGESNRRSARPRSVASKTVDLRYSSAVCVDYPKVDRPRKRGDCASVPRPCPFVSCKWNLYLDVSRNGENIKLNFPDLEPGEVPDNSSCVLDVADGGGEGQQTVGKLMNITRQRVQQIEEIGAEKLRARLKKFPIETE